MTYPAHKAGHAPGENGETGEAVESPGEASGEARKLYTLGPAAHSGTGADGGLSKLTRSLVAPDEPLRYSSGGCGTGRRIASATGLRRNHRQGGILCLIPGLTRRNRQMADRGRSRRPGAPGTASARDRGAAQRPPGRR